MLVMLLVLMCLVQPLVALLVVLLVFSPEFGVRLMLCFCCCCARDSVGYTADEVLQGLRLWQAQKGV